MAGSYKGDMYAGDHWPPQPSQAAPPVRGARASSTKKLGDQRPGVGVRRI